MLKTMRGSRFILIALCVLLSAKAWTQSKSELPATTAAPPAEVASAVSGPGRTSEGAVLTAFEVIVSRSLRGGVAAVAGGT